jgi:hypothetical protein
MSANSKLALKPLIIFLNLFALQLELNNYNSKKCLNLPLKRDISKILTCRLLKNNIKTMSIKHSTLLRENSAKAKFIDSLMSYK